MTSGVLRLLGSAIGGALVGGTAVGGTAVRSFCGDLVLQLLVGSVVIACS